MIRFVSLTILFVTLSSGCSKSSSPTDISGTYVGLGSNFVETLIADSASGTFRHTFSVGETTICNETGLVSFAGAQLIFSDFTEHVDDKTGEVRSVPKRFISTSYYFLEGPPFDMLKPFPEHDYFLKRTNQPARQKQ